MRFTLANLLPNTLIQWLVLIAIVTVVIALLVPPARWASSGDIEIPVRIVVFDAATSEPIEEASVAIVRAMPPMDQADPAEYHEHFLVAWERLSEGTIGSMTDTDGSAIIVVQFSTGASHTNPTPRAHLRGHWIIVSAGEYGSVAVPLRYESMTTKSLREQQPLPAYVGLMRHSTDTQ
jgi:hypothetical protein